MCGKAAVSLVTVSSFALHWEEDPVTRLLRPRNHTQRNWQTPSQEIGISLARPYYHPRARCGLERAQKIRGLLLLLVLQQ